MNTLLIIIENNINIGLRVYIILYIFWINKNDLNLINYVNLCII